MSSPRPSTTSRAYWELRAEQVMDRVFAAASAPLPPAQRTEPPIELVEVHDGGASPMAASGPRPWLIAGHVVPARLALGLAAGLTCLGLGTGLSLWHGWSEAHQDLRQERNLRLLEGIRSLAAAPAASNPSPPAGTAAGEGLPPPPPTEPWIEDLGQLGGPGSGLAPLQVPLSGTLRAPAPPASPATGGAAAVGSDGVPQLLGVVQIPGRPGSAIFQLGGSSSNALVGEAIGSSGWRLVSTSGNGVVIERGGVSRRVSISSGF
mgnify:CR=1 FL=1